MTDIKVSANETNEEATYAGEITIGDAVFNYLLHLPGNFDILDRISDIDPQKLLGTTAVFVHAGERLLSLNEEEKGFFFGYAAHVARELFYSAQRHGLQELAREMSVETPKSGLEMTMHVDLGHPVVQKLLERARQK